jgi:hypothetical protein
VGNQDIGALISSGSATGLQTWKNQLNERLCFATKSPGFHLEWYSLVSILAFKWSILGKVSYYSFLVSRLFKTSMCFNIEAISRVMVVQSPLSYQKPWKASAI